ncbi:hypothetical protein CLPU_1c03270 [Gottschalkia purinilytica]|uniref:DUF1540 domain-containing protein n=1 Tax=Gottschalkia purinilytica TaxID=1503 RepID=A0A0L0WFA0_GOTPU|nr:DUF1540 domain-containing protein [Gottschalkia purinilytica]KNF10162.1 hypothetical protein CLPU_1c03270 [Gottschalkia purinilytica]
MSKAERTGQPLGGVKCIVNTCYFHGGNEDYCTASSIEVQPRNASNSDETDCATFRPSTK